eukprot:TRINITY_DN3247_c0_g1_i1.p1 TRINITY_DN3247_c0_g1~~TRINITY_DN3247_c0_g1_i1.p1  ORF type:complete len:132 (+),score=10.51 TRINITY_DN3247_c0_g1_i1:116-511(+)
MRTHTNVTPFYCTLCNKRFSTQNGILKNNILKSVHENKREFKCKYCPMAFNQSYPLRIHENAHTNNEEFECKKKIVIKNSSVADYVIIMKRTNMMGGFVDIVKQSLSVNRKWCIIKRVFMGIHQNETGQGM